MVAVKVRRSVHTMASTYHSEDVRHLAKFTAMMLGVVDAVEKCCFSCSEDDVRGVWRMAWPMMEGERGGVDDGRCEDDAAERRVIAYIRIFSFSWAVVQHHIKWP